MRRHTGFDYYREAFSASGMAQIKPRLAQKLTMPILALGGEGSLGAAMLSNLQPLATDVRGGVLAGCGHDLPEECPEEFMQAVADFWHQVPASRNARGIRAFEPCLSLWLDGVKTVPGVVRPPDRA